MPIEPKFNLSNPEALASNIINQIYSIGELRFLMQAIEMRKLLLSAPSTPEETSYITTHFPKLQHVESLIVEHYPEVLL